MDSIESHHPNSPTSSPIHPHRASSIYQYHNAPEVLPAHGLEYDDTIYPISDKYPVPHDYSYSSSHQPQNYYDRNNKPPRIIFGMKVRSFLLVSALFCLIVVGSVVGGTVGGRGNSTSGATATATSSTGVQTVAATSAHTSAATATATPLSSCPGTNDTVYTYTNPSILPTPLTSTSATATATTSASTATSASATLSSSSSSKANSTQTFTLHCDTTVSLNSTQVLTAAYVYTLEDCVGICGAWNTFGGSTGEDVSECEVVVYEAERGRPVNCWVSSDVVGGGLVGMEGVAVAVLNG